MRPRESVVAVGKVWEGEHTNGDVVGVKWFILSPFKLRLLCTHLSRCVAASARLHGFRCRISGVKIHEDYCALVACHPSEEGPVNMESMVGNAVLGPAL